jgi:hypothetical protein
LIKKFILALKHSKQNLWRQGSRINIFTYYLVETNKASFLNSLALFLRLNLSIEMIILLLKS